MRAQRNAKEICRREGKWAVREERIERTFSSSSNNRRTFWLFWPISTISAAAAGVSVRREREIKFVIHRRRSYVAFPVRSLFHPVPDWSPSDPLRPHRPLQLRLLLPHQTAMFSVARRVTSEQELLSLFKNTVHRWSRIFKKTPTVLISPSLALLSDDRFGGRRRRLLRVFEVRCG